MLEHGLSTAKSTAKGTANGTANFEELYLQWRINYFDSINNS